MKHFLNLLFLYFPLVTLAQNSTDELLDKCLPKVYRDYRKNGQPSDRERKVAKHKLLRQGEILKGPQNQTLGIFDQDVLVYFGSGSFYSGYFQDYLVADPVDCRTLAIFNVYSE